MKGRTMAKANHMTFTILAGVSALAMWIASLNDFYELFLHRLLGSASVLQNIPWLMEVMEYAVHGNFAAFLVGICFLLFPLIFGLFIFLLARKNLLLMAIPMGIYTLLQLLRPLMLPYEMRASSWWLIYLILLVVLLALYLCTVLGFIKTPYLLPAVSLVMLVFSAVFVLAVSPRSILDNLGFYNFGKLASALIYFLTIALLGFSMRPAPQRQGYGYPMGTGAPVAPARQVPPASQAAPEGTGRVLQQAAAPASPAPKTSAERLNVLKSLKEKGLISEEEYAKKRQEILSNL